MIRTVFIGVVAMTVLSVVAAWGVGMVAIPVVVTLKLLGVVP